MKAGDLVKVIKASDPCHSCMNRFVLVKAVESVHGCTLVYILNPFTGYTELFSSSYLQPPRKTGQKMTSTISDSELYYKHNLIEGD
jgi:hypothetical protein